MRGVEEKREKETSKREESNETEANIQEGDMFMSLCWMRAPGLVLLIWKKKKPWDRIGKPLWR